MKTLEYFLFYQNANNTPIISQVYVIKFAISDRVTRGIIHCVTGHEPRATTLTVESQSPNNDASL